MSNKKVWMITGAGRGMGVDFAKAALASGHAVVASARDSNQGRGCVERPAGGQAGRDQTRRCRSGGSGRSGPVRPHRRAGQQRRQLPCRFLRGAHAGAVRAAVGGEPHWPDERHPRDPAGHAQAALGAHHLDLLDRGPRGLRVRYRLRRDRSSVWRAGWRRCTPRERNAVRSDSIYQMDLGLAKTSACPAGHPLWSCDSRHSTSSTRRTSAPRPRNRSAAAFGTITATYDPRQLQIGLKLHF